MCGIWFYIGKKNETSNSHTAAIKMLTARGPEDMERVDLSGIGTMGFTRLAINGLHPGGMQPMTNGRLWWMCNGEIYNWRELAEKYEISCTSGSDCEVIGHLFDKLVVKGDTTHDAFLRLLDGVFSLVIVDIEEKKALVARDPYGVRPLYFGYEYSIDGDEPIGLYIASEMKSIFPYAQSISHFIPGTYMLYDTTSFRVPTSKNYHTIPTLKNPMLSDANMACMNLRAALEAAVTKRMMTERPVAALLSGGVDSSLIASLVAKNLREAGAPPLRTFSIGMEGSTDLFYARKVAAFIGSQHEEVILTADDFFDAIPEVIQTIESYDTTTVRASVGNWLVAREVRRRSDCKVVFNGDGSDEVFGSYLYFYKAPHDSAYEEEVTRLLKEIHMFDVLRSDKSISSHGLEPRTPFLDKQFVAVARSCSTDLLRPKLGEQVEKWLLRRAFDDGNTLPHDVLWRKKEAFSDGVSSQEKSWYEIIQEKAEAVVPSDWKERAVKNYNHMTPQTAEQYLYRFCFERNYGKESTQTIFPYFWMPRWTPGATDPSARTLAVYRS